MADTKSLRLIGYGLSAVTMLVTIVAALLVAEATRIMVEPPAAHAAVSREAAFWDHRESN
jgi:hypothetical protein